MAITSNYIYTEYIEYLVEVTLLLSHNIFDGNYNHI